jgi:L-lactate permease
LVAVFFIFWAPYTILTVVLSFCGQACINAIVYEFLYWWLWVKSAVNPFLYAYSNSKYRENYHKCLTCKCFNEAWWIVFISVCITKYDVRNSEIIHEYHVYVSCLTVYIFVFWLIVRLADHNCNHNFQIGSFTCFADTKITV